MCALYSLLMMFILIDPSEEIKVTKRWDYLKTPGQRCTMAFTDKVGRNFFKNPYSLGHTMAKWAARSNCSLVSSELSEAGNPNSTGHYDGYVGAIQRDEFDTAVIIVRADTLPFEPGKLTPPLYSADVAILSVTKGQEMQIIRGVTSFLDLQLPVWIYVVLGLFFVVPLILVHDERDEQDILHPLTYLKCYMHNCSTMVNLFFDQEQFTPRHLSAYILAFTSSLFMLFAVFGILFSTVGSNMVVRRAPIPIDTLDDLLASDRTAIVLSTLFAGRVIDSAPEKTKLHQLKNRMDRIIIDHNDRAQINQFLAGGLQTFIDRLANHSAVYLMARKWATHIKRVSCFVKDKFQSLDKLHLSTGSFASGIMTFLMSHKVHPHTEKIISYCMITMLETGNWLALGEIIKPAIPDILGYPDMKYDTSTLKCIDNLHEIQEQVFTPFSLGHMQLVFVIWASCLAIACFTFALEFVLHHSNTKASQLAPTGSARSVSSTHLSSSFSSELTN